MQLVMQILNKILARHALKCIGFKVFLQERIKMFPPEPVFEEKEEIRALNIRYTGERLVGMLHIFRHFKVRKFRALRFGQGAFEARHIKRLFHDRALFAVQIFHNPVFHIGREPFIQPCIAPTGICDQISGPAMGQLMCHNIGQTFIPRDQGRRQERQPRIFHTAKRKTRRQDDQIITPPKVRPVKTFIRLFHQRRFREFLGGGIQNIFFCINPDMIIDWFKIDIPDRECQKIGRDRLRHIK